MQMYHILLIYPSIGIFPISDYHKHSSKDHGWESVPVEGRGVLWVDTQEW